MVRTYVNAWREILARVLGGFAVRYDETPRWLVNPDTGRRLKLDVLYPEIGVAIRFVGLQGSQTPRYLSLEEEEQQTTRDAARAELCRAHGINLVAVDVTSGEPKTILQELRYGLSDASRRLARSDLPLNRKGELIERLSQARSQLETISNRMTGAASLGIYAQLWQDRTYAEQPLPPQMTGAGKAPPAFEPGMRVRHVTYGEGTIERIQDDGRDQLIGVRFADGTRRTFAASLVAGKLLAPTHF
jgi:hypothetical protein